MDKKILRLTFLVLGVILVAIHTYAFLTPSDLFYVNMPVFDKIEHFLAGVVIAGLVSTFLKEPSVLALLVIVLFLGIVWEIGETQMGYDAENDAITDIIFNQLGCLTIALVIARRR